MVSKLNLKNRPILLSLVITLVLSSVGVLLLLYHTHNGPGITGDSVSYVMGAENLVAGRGYSRTAGGGEAVPITGFPPGYSVFLASAAFLGDNFFQIGRIVNAALFGVNIFLAGFLIWKFTQSVWASVLGSSIILLSDDLIFIHSWVMSEGLFITLMLVGIHLLIPYLENGDRRTLVLAGLLFGGATLTRYVGIALIGAGLLAILFINSKDFKQRVVDASLFGLMSFAPVFLWLFRNASLEGTTTNRELAFHPPSRELIIAFLGTANAWTFPLRLGIPKTLRAMISASVFLLIPGAYFFSSIREGDRPGGIARSPYSTLPWFLGLLIPLYLFVLIANTTFLDASTSTAGAARYLAPVFVVAVVWIIGMVAQLSQYWNHWIKRYILAVLALFILSMYAVRAITFISDPGRAFRYTDNKHEMVDVVATIGAIDTSTILISNDIQLVYVLSDRPAYLFPILFDKYRQKDREDFNEQIEFAREKLEEGAILIVFTPMKDEEMMVLELLDVVAISIFDEAIFYAAEGG